MEVNNNRIVVSEKIRGVEREKWNLQIDRIYAADKIKAKTLAGEVLSKLFIVGNAGGFRVNGPIENPNYIVIYTSGDDAYWRDEIDNSLGVLLYYGDNRTPGNDLHNTKKGGNKILRNIFNYAASEEISERKNIPPIFVFKKYEDSRDMKFLGLAVPGIKGKPKKDWLTAVWGCNRLGERFLNYKAFFTILDTSKGHTGEYDTNINLAWLTDLEKNHGYDSLYAPLEWKRYIDGKVYNPLMCKTERFVKSKAEQLPTDKVQLDMLNALHKYFLEKDNGYSFETFANDMVIGIDDNVIAINGTRYYKDGGYDGIGNYQLFKGSQNEVMVEFYVQAKCYNLDNSVSVKDTARLISRIKDRQFGIMLTTSYVAQQAFDEILEDGHPIVILSGKNIVEYIVNELELYDVESLLRYLNRKY